MRDASDVWTVDCCKKSYLWPNNSSLARSARFPRVTLKHIIKRYRVILSLVNSQMKVGDLGFHNREKWHHIKMRIQIYI